MDRRAVFKTVKEHLLQQETPCGDYAGCRYHGDHGKKCAVGCLIPSSLYTNSLEGHSVSNPEIIRVVEKALDVKLNMEDVSFLMRLQTFHDKAAKKNVGKFTEEMFVELEQELKRAGMF